MVNGAEYSNDVMNEYYRFRDSMRKKAEQEREEFYENYYNRESVSLSEALEKIDSSLYQLYMIFMEREIPLNELKFITLYESKFREENLLNMNKHKLRLLASLRQFQSIFEVKENINADEIEKLIQNINKSYDKIVKIMEYEAKNMALKKDSEAFNEMKKIFNEIENFKQEFNDILRNNNLESYVDYTG